MIVEIVVGRLQRHCAVDFEHGLPNWVALFDVAKIHPPNPRLSLKEGGLKHRVYRKCSPATFASPIRRLELPGRLPSKAKRKGGHPVMRPRKAMATVPSLHVIRSPNVQMSAILREQVHATHLLTGPRLVWTPRLLCHQAFETWMKGLGYGGEVRVQL